MRMHTNDLPVSMEAPGTKMANVDWGGIVVNYVELPGGADFTPMFEGLPNNQCQCPHWGYVLEGAVFTKYADGTEEKTTAGEVFYWPAGHTGWVEEDSAFIDFSPAEEFKVVADHIAAKMESTHAR